MHEDGHLEEAIREALGDRALELAAAHIVLEQQVGRVGTIIDAALGANGRLAGPRSTWRTSNWRPSSAPTCTIRTTRSAS